MHFTVKLADLLIEIDSQFEYLQRYCKDYCIEEVSATELKPDFSISLSMEEIEAERNHEDVTAFSSPYLETLAALRKICEQMAFYNRILCHGAVISYAKNDAYMFTAPSGTGKSTHINLWRKYLGEAVEVVNGDKPLIKIEDASATIYGTPWAGKEGWQKNTAVTLKGICIIERGTTNEIVKVNPMEQLIRLMHQVHVPNGAEAAGKTLELFSKLFELVPLYVIKCDMSEDAVRASFEAMTGLDYDACKVIRG